MFTAEHLKDSVFVLAPTQRKNKGLADVAPEGRLHIRGPLGNPDYIHSKMSALVADPGHSVDACWQRRDWVSEVHFFDSKCDLPFNKWLSVDFTVLRRLTVNRRKNVGGFYNRVASLTIASV